MAHMKVRFESKGLYKDSQLYESLMLLSFNVLKTKFQHHRAPQSTTELIRSTVGEAGLQERKC